MSKKLALVIATYFGLGLSPKAPGTVGSIGTIPLALALAYFFGLYGILIAAIIVTIIGIAAFFLGIVANPLSAIFVSVISGTVGCFMDSILGALFENRHIITNEHVNLVATIVGAIVGILLI